jgi:hypothetical protein
MFLDVSIGRMAPQAAGWKRVMDHIRLASIRTRHAGVGEDP